MKDTIKVETPESTPEDQVQQTVEQRKQSLIDERKARLLGTEEAETEETEEVEVETPDIEAEETEEVEDEPTDEENVHSQTDEIDIDSLSEDDIREIAKLKGIELGEETKSDKAWAAMRRKFKDMEAERDSERSAKEEALSIRSSNDAETKLTQTEANLKYWNRKLQLSAETQYDEASGNDVRGVTHEGKFYPAEQLVNWLDEQEATLPDLRKAANEVTKARESIGNLDDAIEEVKTKYGLDEKASEAYDKFLSNPKFEVLKSMIPEFSVELIDIFGKAALQTAGSSAKKKVVIKRKAPKEAKDNVSPTGGSGRPAGGKGASTQVKKLEKIVSDPKVPVKDRMAAQKQIRLLKYST